MYYIFLSKAIFHKITLPVINHLVYFYLFILFFISNFTSIPINFSYEVREKKFML